MISLDFFVWVLENLLAQGKSVGAAKGHCAGPGPEITSADLQI